MAAISEQALTPLIEALRGVLCQVAEPTVVLRTILDQAVTRTGADRGVFVEVSGSGELSYQVLHQFKRSHLEGEGGHFSRGIFAEVLETGEGMMLDSAFSHPRFRLQQSVEGVRMASVLCMPIRSRDRIAALVHLENSKPGHFKEEHREVLRSLLDVAGPVLEALQAGREAMRERDRLQLSEARFREEAEQTRELLARDWSFGRFVGRSPAVRELESAVRKAAATDFPVLLLGETGTGKSILARVLHHSGPRANQALVTVFCPSLERGMVEAELFGHRKGSFTGALADRLGKVPAADKGSLFLDEIGELPMEIQPKLLRLLQEKTYERVGDPAERKADVRVIAATNRDLEQEVREGRFRRDLYERLNFVPLRIPPLRERVEDIPLLLRHALDQHEAGRWIELADDARDYLSTLDFTWPGNVRHVEQLAARLTLESKRGAVTCEELARALDARPQEPERATPRKEERGAQPRTSTASSEPAGLEEGLPTLLEKAEKAWLEQALERYPRLTRAELAAKLKISESALYKKLRLYDLGG
ncbi:MAG TPA: sigma-54-dependent Fis family transcriptional regulator [Candidatus Eisenbacteria bacterium]|jgi:transcriptional regulator with GAF, ATPase, and Fis domain